MVTRKKHFLAIVLSKTSSVVHVKNVYDHLANAKNFCSNVSLIYRTIARLLVVAEEGTNQVWLACFDRATGKAGQWYPVHYKCAQALFKKKEMSSYTARTLYKKYLEEVSYGQDVSSRQ